MNDKLKLIDYEYINYLNPATCFGHLAYLQRYHSNTTGHTSFDLDRRHGELHEKPNKLLVNI
jgi:hypothetical protein